jgi:hypothetical protein
MRILILAFLFLFSSCGIQDMQTYIDAYEAVNTELMEKETGPMGTYFQTREFHGKMIMECPEPLRQPYPAMKTALDTMGAILVQMQERRGDLYLKSTFLAEGRKKIKQKELDRFLSKLESKKKTCLTKFEADEVYFNASYGTYDSLRNHHGIVYVSHADYADSLLNRIMIWEDSLEIQGGRIAKALQQLKQVVPDTKSEKHISFYQPISQMQLLHKELQSHLTGAENAMNRYQSAPQDEGYFVGPYLVERHDVLSTEQLFEEMQSNMLAFRNREEQFMNFVRR